MIDGYVCIRQKKAVVGPAHYTFRYNQHTIKRGDLPFDFDAVLYGHIHRHQILIKQKPGIDRLRFFELPSRPMYDLKIDLTDNVLTLIRSIKSAIVDFEENAIVRLNCDLIPTHEI